MAAETGPVEPWRAAPASNKQRTGMVTALAPAKINLALHVTGQRADGYHLLESLAVFADDGACDVITIRSADTDMFAAAGTFGSAFDGLSGDNLVIRARDWLRAVAVENGFAAPPVAMTLAKELPVASGMGGGSADAAATLWALMRCWDLPKHLLDDRDTELSGALGADVPMCLAGVALIARGIGERIEAVAGLPKIPAVIVNPGQQVATPDVFGALLQKTNPPMPGLPENGGGSTARLATWLAEHCRNDLEAPAIAMAPVIADVMTAISGNGARMVRMSGSGATCFGLFDDIEQAHAAARAIASAAPSWWIRPAILNSSGPKA